ncbi:MAG: cell division-like protein, partial [bacterium]|nr:cell division-like protein [bacterium]
PEASPVPGTAVAEGRVAARELIDRIVKTLDERRQASQGAYGAQAASFGPSVLVVLDGEAELPRAEVDRLLTEGPRLGVHVLWLGSTAQSLPGECGAVVEVDERTGAPRIMLPNQATTIQGFASDLAGERVVQDLALALAPIHDVEAAGGAAEIPRTAGLLELLELDEDVERRIAQRWQQDDGRLSARLGIAAGGLPCEISLRYDGPHALAGGMTGAGKSELLQTFVASLAAAHSPARLNFILVDYKGGAAFKDCVNLPHTVGFVTDLDGHLVNRALTSLRAELRRREEVLRQAGCKDLIDFEARDLAHAFPSLVIVVDEFAALVAELPEFVDGMVDIAQRGRSLGIHMVLATQRPAGVINDKIRTNTNLRLSLRFSDTDDSQDVIGTNDAARPGLPRGRAFVRAGPGNLTEFQAAHASGRSVIEGGPAPIVVRDMDVAGDPVEEAGGGGPGGGGPSDLQRVVQAVGSVHDRLGMPAPPRPWLEVLPEVLPLEWLERALPDPSAATVPLGLLDDPSHQRQLPALFDLAEDGSLLIYGTSGTGKTTYLRALTASLARRLPPDRLHVYGLDFATRGLRPLLGLPHCGGIVAGDEPERALRLLRMLRAALESRKTVLASAGASTLAEYHRAGGAPLPTILLLLDGYSGFKSAFDDVELGAPVDWFRELVAEGRPLGLSAVFTGDRSSAVQSQLVATVSRRLVLRMANEDEYGFLNVPRTLYRDATLPAGRGFTDHNLEMQGPIVGQDPAGNAQAAALEALGAELRARYPDARVPQVRLLPTALSRDSLPAPPGPLEAVVGLLDGDLQPARIDLGAEGHLLIVGPRRSGRTTVLLAIASSLLRGPDPVPVFALAPRRQSALATFPGLTEVAVGQDACAALADRIAAALDGPGDLDLSRGGVVLVDDGDELFDGPAGFGLETLAQRGRDANVRLAAAFETQAAHRAFSGFINQIQRDRNGILLDPDPTLDGTLVGGVRLPQRRGPMPPGRANLVTGGEVLVAQIAGEA